MKPDGDGVMAIQQVLAEAASELRGKASERPGNSAYEK